MQIEKAVHKMLLYKELSGNQFPIEKLADAHSAAKKIAEGSTREDSYINFVDGAQTFTPEEWLVLKDMMRGVKHGSIETADALFELRKMFEL